VTSTDGGVTWTQQTGSGQRTWQSIASSADGNTLIAGTSGGDIYVSTDGGLTWTDQTAPGAGTWYAVASSADGTTLAAVAQVAALKKIGRVVKPSGSIRLLEYTRPRGWLRRATTRIWEPWISWAYGASFDCRTEEHIPEAGLAPRDAFRARRPY
jgi:hypothetical protein